MVTIDAKTVPERTGSGIPEEVRLKRAEWELLREIDGKRTAGEIARYLDRENREIFSILSNLYQKNLIKVQISADKVYVDKAFFTNLEQILTEYIGPVAPFVIDEMLVELNEDRSEFDSAKLPLLTEMISRTIEDDGKRVEYQRVMLKHLSKA
jgi:hypothetical protein